MEDKKIPALSEEALGAVSGGRMQAPPEGLPSGPPAVSGASTLSRECMSMESPNGKHLRKYLSQYVCVCQYCGKDLKPDYLL